MKIALIGNMNNNNFAMMRYFRDIGVDAHLLLYTNDGQGSLSHFKPEDDTWEIERWRPYIHQTPFQNGLISGASFLYSFVLYIRQIFNRKYWAKGMVTKYPTRKLIQSTFGEFDILIGTGIAPALLEKAGLALTCFVPYGVGIEYVGSLLDIKNRTSEHPLKRLLSLDIHRNQLAGIRRAKLCCNADLGLTATVFHSHDIDFKRIAMPMVYNCETELAEFKSNELLLARQRIERSGFSIISHGRQYWKNPGYYTDTEWESRSKHNEWLIHAFSALVAARPKKDCLLVLFEYGDDVVHTKQLCDQLNLTNNVLFVPKMSRKEILLLIKECDIGVGEFYTDHGTIWGGTGWETLSCGKPLLQGFTFAEGEFEKQFGYPPPPMLPVRRQEDILPLLLHLVDNPEICQKIGQSALDWFNHYNGSGLAKQWLDLLKGTKSI